MARRSFHDEALRRRDLVPVHNKVDGLEAIVKRIVIVAALWHFAIVAAVVFVLLV